LATLPDQSISGAQIGLQFVLLITFTAANCNCHYLSTELWPWY